MNSGSNPSRNDIFISYSTADNGFRWVNLLMATLKTLFRNINRDVEPTFFLDERSLRGNDPLDETLKQNVQDSGVFLIVMSENWCDSKYCPRELEWFIEAAGGLEKARRRTFILRLSDYPVSRWPEVLKQNIAKQFFEENQRSGVNEPISWDFKDTGKPPSVCTDLALELWDCLEAQARVPVRKSRSVNAPMISVPTSATQAPGVTPTRAATPMTSPSTVVASSPVGPAVFLSEVHPKLEELRRKLAGDLQREGYQVLPVDREFRNDRDAAVAEIPPMLRQATLVVQLYYERPIGTELFDEGFDRWLKEQAVAGGKTPEDSLLRWRRQGLSAESVKDPQHSALLFENDVVAEDEAQLTALVLRRIRSIEERARASSIAGSGRKILIRSKDAGVSRELRDDLADEIDRFEMDSEGATLEAAIVPENVSLSTIEDQLKRKSLGTVGYIVVYGDTDEEWAQVQMKECRLLALKRRANLPVTAVYVRPPDDQPRPQTIPGRFEVVRHDQVEKLHQLLKQAKEVRA